MEFYDDEIMLRSIIWALITVIVLSGAPSASDSVDSMGSRNDRLAGLCRVWGAIKYFHPYLAYKGIDWDSALITVIPKARKAESPAEYKAAINGLLGYLKDPNTVVLDESFRRIPSKVHQQDTLQPYMLMTDDSCAVIVATDYSQFSGDIYRADQLRDLFAEGTRSRGIVIDIRRLDTPDNPVADSAAQTAFRQAFMDAFSVLLHNDLTLSSSRRRVQVGYVPRATPNPGNYSSAFEYRNAPTMMAAGNEYQSVPLVLVVNEGSNILVDLLAGLQTAHRAWTVYEGYFDQEGGIETVDMALPDSVTVRMRVTELIKPDGTAGFDPDLVLPFTTDTTVLESPPIKLALDLLTGTRVSPPVIGVNVSPIVPNVSEKKYDVVPYPTLDYRLLALFRLWNMARYFSPYVSDMTSAWDSALVEFIPRVEAASDSLEYVQALAELMARLHDSRARVETPALRDYFGVFYPPITVEYVAGETVVSSVAEGVSKLPDVRPGDIILVVDGENADSLRERLSRYISASTPQSLQQKVDSVLLGGRNGSEVHLSIQRGDGKPGNITLIRGRYDHRSRRRGDVYGTLKNGLGYVDLSRITQNQFNAAISNIIDTPGLILDLRGNIGFSPGSLIPYLANRKVPAFECCTPERYTPDPRFAGERCKIETIAPDGHWTYGGRIAALIDANAGEAAERFGLMLRAATDAVFVGTPTTGCAGEITSTVLPGGVSVVITGSDMRYPDGSPLRKTGIRPDIYVEPTIAGIREGKDEILDAAVEYLLYPDTLKKSHR
jgi:C-terminal processing protease CtpA/Prc